MYIYLNPKAYRLIHAVVTNRLVYDKMDLRNVYTEKKVNGCAGYLACISDVFGKRKSLLA